MTDNEKQKYCSFCGKNKKEVARLIDGPIVAVCNDCIDLMYGMLHDPPRQGPALGELLEKRRAERQTRARR